MKLPRDLTGRDVALALSKLGYARTHQTGSHIRLTRTLGGEHHLTIPDHSPLKAGTLNAILREVAAHAGLERRELLDRLFG